MNTSFKIEGLELTVDSADIVEADYDGVTIATRDGLTIRIDGMVADRIVNEQAAQRIREMNMAAAS